MKAENRSACFEREQDRALFCDVFRPARAVNGEGAIPSSPDFARHLHQSSKPPAGAGAASRAVTESLDALGDRVPVAVHAGHDDNATIAPIIGRREDPAVPKREDRAFSGFINFVEVEVAFGLPAYCTSDDVDREVANPTDQPGFKPIH